VVELYLALHQVEQLHEADLDRQLVQASQAHDMKRIQFPSRPNYTEKLHENGFDYENVNDIEYWREEFGYEFTSKDVDTLEAATHTLFDLCLQAVQHVIDNKLYDKLHIPQTFVPLIEKSWQRDDFTLYGRFDLCYKDGKVKMYELNADTPTSLLETSIVQYYWMKDNNLPDQFNSAHEALIEQWKYFKQLSGKNALYFSCIRDSVEDFRNTEYIMDTAHQAGLDVKFIFIDDIGSDGKYFYDLDENVIETLFKLYPWEWLINETFASTLLHDNCQLIEPPWKMILSNKGILAILWEMFPNHPLLLPTYFDSSKVGTSYVKKPLLSREGANISVVKNSEEVLSIDGEYGEEGYVYQELCELPDVDGFRPCIGSWIVGQDPCGMGIREDKSIITGNVSYFVSNYFK
jgi:glutathionylspermidine synthase